MGPFFLPWRLRCSCWQIGGRNIHSLLPHPLHLHHIPCALATRHKLKVHRCHFTSQKRSKDQDKPNSLFSQRLTQTNHPQLKLGSLNLALLKRHRRFVTWPCRDLMETQSKRQQAHTPKSKELQLNTYGMQQAR